ncbi:MAG: class II fructose-bisphosphate aldolase [Oscillospiraceae bacterium]|nr:class II fructose-bisphosphate aldolase [Oscillospiraceae bacterium]
MALISMKKLLGHAEKNHYAVGYFEAFNMDAMLGALDAAESKNSPVIIGFGGQFLGSKKRAKAENSALYGILAKKAAECAKVPAAALLNEADDEQMAYRGMNSGFNAVMYQKAGEKFEDTVKITKEICRIAHILDIDVESEVGSLPCADIGTGLWTEGEKTDVGQAKYFAEQTNIDALAVAIGNVHLLEDKKAEMDFGLLAALRREISVPLALHGGTGIAPGDLKKAIAAGISKINVGTVLKRAYIEAIGKFYEKKDMAKTDPHATIGWGGEEDMISCGRAAIAEKVAEYMDIFGSSGKAPFVR